MVLRQENWQLVLIFPDYDSKQLSGRDFILKIFDSSKLEIKALIKNSRDVWSVAKPEENTKWLLCRKIFWWNLKIFWLIEVI